MKKIVTAALIVMATQFGFAQQDAFKQDVLKYMEMAGITVPIKNVGEQLKTMVPEEKHAEFQKDFDSTLPSLFSKIAEVYMEEFTHDEIKKMITFYNSEVGKKLTAKQEILMEKSEKAGEHWGLDLQLALMKYMEQE